MPKLSFEEQREAWSSPPVDEVGYISSAKMLTWTDEQLRDMVEELERTRYQGERNAGNKWRDTLGLDSTRGKVVLDYGCGTGIESLQYAKASNEVWLADIAATNIDVACRILGLYGYEGRPLVIEGGYPFIDPPTKFDVIHCNGVLHHIPEPEPVMQRFSELLKPDGEVRLMLYSDVAWRFWTGTEPPEDVENHPKFDDYVRAMDSVGHWADWYDYDRISARFGHLFDIQRLEYLRENKTYLGAVLTKRQGKPKSVPAPKKPPRPVKWTIAILTVESRKPLFERLMRNLKKQVGERPIEILVADQEDWTVAKKRQWCLDNAKGEYFNFIDDDDMVAKDYVESIFPLLDGVDYIGFQLQFYHEGAPWKPTYHSLRYHTWYEDANGFYRNVSHLNPIRTDIAREGHFEGGYQEDWRWAQRVKPKTEHYVDKVMYHYYFSPRASLTANNR